jgi:DNA invertase Pin-like site-specific DNA recombinase
MERIMAGPARRQSARKAARKPAAKGAVVGYARTSTAEQEAGLAAQERDLRAAGCGKVFAERVSSVGKRAQLDAALDYLREGDVLMVTKPDRLARSVADLLGIVGELDAKGVALHVMSMGGGALDTGDATGRMMLTVLGAVAEFERTLMLERQREGIARAKAEGRYKGRKPTARAKAGEIQRLRGQGLRPTEIAGRLGIGRASVYRVLKSNGGA